MAAPTTVGELDLSPPPGKTYFDTAREWREEFIYFLMVDRFHDDTARAAAVKPDRALGVQTPNDFYGGKIRGVTRNLDYIAGLGCTAVWLSPIFGNNKHSYHGYDINNYLDVDPRFGTKQDLIDLVKAAHARTPPVRIILDVVVNHSGDNWTYPGGFRYFYSNDQQFPFGGWRQDGLPVPTELRKDYLYHRRGEMGNYDTYPENQHGDMLGLKDYANDDDAAGSELINILIRAHNYWIREADVDGFRVDAVKHMGELACSRFCSGVREYAYSLGKRGFFLFGELANADDEIYDRYIGPNTSKQDGGNTVYFGINSLLDFRLAEGAGAGREPLRDVIKGFAGPGTLLDRLEGAAEPGPEPRRDRPVPGHLHRQPRLVLAARAVRLAGPAGADHRRGRVPPVRARDRVHLLRDRAGVRGPRRGQRDAGGDVRHRRPREEPAEHRLHDLPGDRENRRGLARAREEIRFGRIYFRQISGDGVNFGFPFGNAYTLAFSRVLYGREVVVAYNVSPAPRSDRVIVDAALHKAGDKMTFLYGKAGTVTVEESGGARFVRLDLTGRQFVILA